MAVQLNIDYLYSELKLRLGFGGTRNAISQENNQRITEHREKFKYARNNSTAELQNDRRMLERRFLEPPKPSARTLQLILHSPDTAPPWTASPGNMVIPQLNVEDK